MEITLQLEKMSVGEKILTMEAIWDDLCRTADSIQSPDWHESVLTERDNKIVNGEDEFVDWTRAKQIIRDKVS